MTDHIPFHPQDSDKIEWANYALKTYNESYIHGVLNLARQSTEAP